MKTFYFRKPFVILFLTVLLSTISCSKDESVEDIEKQESLSITNEILELVNVHRASIGSPALSKSVLATQLAEEHTLYMIEQNKMSHDNFDLRGRRLIDEEKAIKVGENVAFKYKTAEEVMEAWLNSPVHLKNIEADFAFIGISAIKNDDDLFYYTQLFFKK
ncbi:Cysteine-rich secretory protein family protein [Flaviramulus basaltis]|uniref:Cysteine-rich secretory protein family protein n=1 Tax=Flaviramulus basaltis TaxID=369401 RepID=A0A1K2IDQ2_9FLAO|nr:CAP domain-containing protein [Flaviramulus basaltis]SFZ90424.1 Cysteine-rich secretory protein family protein [Flaviramulus basaltis]